MTTIIPSEQGENSQQDILIYDHMSTEAEIKGIQQVVLFRLWQMMFWFYTGARDPKPITGTVEQETKELQNMRIENMEFNGVFLQMGRLKLR